MATGTKAAGRFTNKLKNDETFGSLDLKTLVYIVMTVTFFQMGENVSSVFSYLAIGIMLVGSLLIETDQIALAYIVLSASNRLLNVGNNIPLLPIITIVYIARVYMMQKSYKKIRIDTQMMTVLAVFSIYCLRYFFFNYNLSPLTKSLKFFFSFIMLIDVFRKCETKDEARIKFNQMVFYMSLGITVTVLISLIFSSSGDSLGRFSISVNSGANVLGIYVSSAIAATAIILLSENTVLFKRAMALMMIPMIYVGLLTQSRTFAVLSLITILWSFALGFSDKTKRSNTGIVLAITAVIVVLFLIFGKNTNLYELFYTIVDRFINPRHDDVSGGRTELAKAYIAAIFSSAKYTLFGADGSIPSPGGGVVAHNMFIEDIYGNGLVGFVMICVIYVTFFNKVAESFTKLGFSASLAGALPFVLCFVGGMSSHTILGAMPTNEFFIGVCTMYYYGGIVKNTRRTRIQPMSEYKKNRVAKSLPQGGKQ